MNLKKEEMQLSFDTMMLMLKKKSKNTKTFP